LEKSPVTPPDVLHDKERGKGAKKEKKTGLKYIARLFSEYMLTFRAEEPMKICVTN
jgi:hypothetical protein